MRLGLFLLPSGGCGGASAWRDPRLQLGVLGSCWCVAVAPSELRVPPRYPDASRMRDPPPAPPSRELPPRSSAKPLGRLPSRSVPAAPSVAPFALCACARAEPLLPLPAPEPAEAGGGEKQQSIERSLSCHDILRSMLGGCPLLGAACDPRPFRAWPVPLPARRLAEPWPFVYTPFAAEPACCAVAKPKGVNVAACPVPGSRAGLSSRLVTCSDGARLNNHVGVPAIRPIT
jgi:hypothetical protein